MIKYVLKNSSWKLEKIDANFAGGKTKLFKDFFNLKNKVFAGSYYDVFSVCSTVAGFSENTYSPKKILIQLLNVDSSKDFIVYGSSMTEEQKKKEFVKCVVIADKKLVDYDDWRSSSRDVPLLEKAFNAKLKFFTKFFYENGVFNDYREKDRIYSKIGIKKFSEYLKFERGSSRINKKIVFSNVSDFMQNSVFSEEKKKDLIYQYFKGFEYSRGFHSNDLAFVYSIDTNSVRFEQMDDLDREYKNQEFYKTIALWHD